MITKDKVVKYDSLLSCRHLLQFMSTMSIRMTVGIIPCTYFIIIVIIANDTLNNRTLNSHIIRTQITRFSLGKFLSNRDSVLEINNLSPSSLIHTVCDYFMTFGSLNYGISRVKVSDSSLQCDAFLWFKYQRDVQIAIYHANGLVFDDLQIECHQVRNLVVVPPADCKSQSQLSFSKRRQNHAQKSPLSKYSSKLKKHLITAQLDADEFCEKSSIDEPFDELGDLGDQPQSSPDLHHDVKEAEAEAERGILGHDNIREVVLSQHKVFKPRPVRHHDEQHYYSLSSSSSPFSSSSSFSSSMLATYADYERVGEDVTEKSKSTGEFAEQFDTTNGINIVIPTTGVSVVTHQSTSPKRSYHLRLYDSSKPLPESKYGLLVENLYHGYKESVMKKIFKQFGFITELYFIDDYSR